jgi:hypothetical protein
VADNRHPNEAPAKWYKRPEWWTVVAAVLTFSIIIWQSYETRRAATASWENTKSMTDQIAIMQRQTLIAQESVRALVNSERAWLMPVDFVLPRALSSVDPTRPPDFTVRIRNYGRTPAFLTAWICRAVLVDNDDILRSLDYDNPSEHPSGMPFPPEREDEFFVHPCWPEPAGEVRGRVARGSRLYVYGMLRYFDFSRTNMHETYFCFRYDRETNTGLTQSAGWSVQPPEANRVS